MNSTRQQSKRARSKGSSLEMAQFIDAGANKIKKRIRDLERLLSRKRDSLPDTIIVEKERTLEALKLELENAKLKTKIKENAKKYHMVRFFERKKALRRYKKAKKVVEESKGDKKAKKDLEEKKIDLCYVVNFPKTEKYIALYPSNEEIADKAGLEKTELRKKAFREVIAEQLEMGTLPVSLEQILQGKKLDKERSGVSLEETNTEGVSAVHGKHEEEEEDEFFE